MITTYLQFSDINKIIISLSDLNLNTSDDLPIIDNIEDLTICYEIYSSQIVEAAIVKFSSLLKNFRNIKKLCITTTTIIAQKYLSDYISGMKKLEEIYLYAKIKNVKQIGFIKTSCPRLRKLYISKVNENAKKYFGPQVIVNKINFREGPQF